MELNNDNQQNAPPHGQRTSTTADQQPQHRHASNAELLDSAKYLAGAAFNRGSSDKVDTGRTAGAAADLLDAAAHYGHLEDKSFGKYVDQAEDYLHKYQSSHSTTSAPAPTSATAVPHDSSSSGQAPPARKDSEDISGSGGGGGGCGDYIKMAQGFLNK